jgi:putative membrane protein
VGWSFDPVPLAALLLAAGAYARRAWTLRSRGRPLAAHKPLAFGCALVVLLLAAVSPLDTIGEERLFSAHMAQHLLIGDVAPLLAVLGLSGPLVRPLLAVRLLQRLRVAAHPFVALPVWALDLWLWHLPRLYDAALDRPLVHSLEHACFFTGGLLLWVSLLGLLPGPRWLARGGRLASLGAVWLAGGALANLFIWSGHAYYPPYVHAPRTWGLSPLADQRAGGGVMLVEMMFVGAVAFTLLGLRWLDEAERRQLRLDPR